MNQTLEQKTHWRNLAPKLVRQRVIVEGTTPEIVKQDFMRQYLTDLAVIANMEILSGPYAYSAHELGYGGWVHWRTSGAHIYSYPPELTQGDPLFTVDMYTCKFFDTQKVIDFTKLYLNANEIVWQEIKP